jgi:TRAP-type mannitol/chloroaromatic compound transport system substrate-binding protein
MKRRDFLKKAAAGGLLAAGAVTSAPALAASKKRFNWKMVTAWPANMPILQQGVERFASDIEKMSDRRLRISVYAAGELVPALQVFDAVSQGTAEMGHGAAYYWSGKMPAAQFFTTVPFGMNAQGMNAWLYYGGGLRLWRDIYAPFNLIPLPMGNTGMQTGGWFRKKINSAADLKGLKMRIPGLGGLVLTQAGVTPVQLADNEIASALERGTIDAAEWLGPFHDLRLGLQRAAKFCYYPGWHEPGATLELTINRKAWSELPEELQIMVETASAAANTWMQAEFEAKNLQALQELKQKHKIEVLPFPDEVIKELKRLTHLTLESEAAKDAAFKQVYQVYRAFRDSNDGWSNISEAAYTRTLKL